MQRHLFIGATVIAALLAAERIPLSAQIREAPVTGERDVMTLMVRLECPVHQPPRTGSRPPDLV